MRGDHEGQHAVAKRVDADGLRQPVLPVDGVKRQSDARPLDQVEDQHRKRDTTSEHEVVVVDRRIEIDGDEAEIEFRQTGDALDAGRSAERDR